MQNEITELRNQVRTLKRIVYGFGCLLVAGIVVGATSLQTVPDVIQAKKFEVVNDEGKVVASFYANMGGGMLSFSNKDGKVVAGLGSDEVNGGGVLGINNKDGKTVAGIYADENGGVARVLNNKFTEVVQIDVDKNGDGQLRIFDREGKQFARLFLDDVGNGGLGIYNKDSKYEVAGLGVYDGWGVLGIYDRDGEVVARLRAANYGTSENGGGLLKIFNKDIKEVVHIGVDEDGNGVVQTPNGKDEEISVAPSDELCCQHPHHLECTVNTASAPPGSCQHSHHLECGVTKTK
jgi:hypothetical protein